MKTYKTRHQFYLPDALSEMLEAMASKPGTSKTAILTDALTAWFERQGAQELDKRFGHRLDRQSRATERSERKLDALTELVGVFVQHQLASTAHQPGYDDAAAHLGRERFYKLLGVVEQRLAKGSPLARLTAPPSQSGDDP
jgi:hypothetical protein